jgi:hypothetical protein
MEIKVKITQNFRFEGVTYPRDMVIDVPESDFNKHFMTPFVSSVFAEPATTEPTATEETAATEPTPVPEQPTPVKARPRRGKKELV